MKTEPLINQEALQHHKHKGLRQSFSYWDSLAQEHAIAFTVAKMMDNDLLGETHAAVEAALANGTDFREFKNRLKPYLMSRGWWGQQVMGDPLTGEIKKVQLGSLRRLRIIYHTNLHSAYAAGQWRRIQETKDLLPYLQYMPSEAKEPRDAHRRYYGLVRPVDDPIWQVIFPPNGYGCLCWVKQLTEKEAKSIGISPKIKLQYEEVINKRIGEVLKAPIGIHPSFTHNHDRLSAMQTLYAEKLKAWSHIPEAQKSARKAAFEADLNRYMLDLVNQPDFNSMVPTVVGADFARRFEELAAQVNASRSGKGSTEELRNLQRKLSRDQWWVAATISADVQKQLGSNTALVYLSDQSVIKELYKHTEIPLNSLLSMLRDTHLLIKNAVAIIKENKENHIMYFLGEASSDSKEKGKKVYRASIKMTQDRQELYINTIFISNAGQMENKIKEALQEGRLLLDNRKRKH